MKTLSIGRYRIEAELGEGRYCETYQAYDLVRRRPVALKLLRPGLFPEARVWRGFLADAQRAADLVHPHIAWIWETGELDGRYYLVERFVGGETLAAQLADSGPIPTDQAVKSLEQIAQAIEFGQQRGWTHGGINPRNILISPDLGAVLSDYGLLNAIRQHLGEAPPQLKDSCYLPPEVLQGRPITPGADLYGLACCLAEALSGQNPFSGLTLDEILEKKTAAFETPQLPFETVPPQASQVIERALHPDPSARFKDALDFMDTFERAVRHGLTDAAGRAQHEDQLRRWRESKEQERIQAEEASRLEALATARREIIERARLEAEQIIDQQEPPRSDTAAEDRPSPAAPRRRKKGSLNRRLTLAVLGILIAALILGGIWLANQESRVGLLAGSPTPTNSATSQTLPTNTPSVQTLTSTPVPTGTSLPSATPRPSLTATLNPTPTSSLTSTATFPPPSSTPDRLNRDSRPEISD